MIQGTMSNAGKSLLAAGLCRVLSQDGLRVAPFKSQNMALNSGVTADGLEMGRAQIMQAEACGIVPDVRMNPILLKPESDHRSQLIVAGKAQGAFAARDYFAPEPKGGTQAALAETTCLTASTNLSLGNGGISRRWAELYIRSAFISGRKQTMLPSSAV